MPFPSIPAPGHSGRGKLHHPRHGLGIIDVRDHMDVIGGNTVVVDRHTVPGDSFTEPLSVRIPVLCESQ